MSLLDQNTRNPRHVSEIKDIPECSHYVVLTDESFSYDDGYGDRGVSSTSTHRNLSYQAFFTEDALQEWIKRNDESAYGRKPFTVLRVTPVKVQKTVTFEFQTP